MLRPDLEDAKIPYVDDAGRYVDFHALRDTTGSFLVASGAHPKVVQSIMRHSDINLKTGRYSENAVIERARQDSNLQPSDSKSAAAKPYLLSNKGLTKTTKSVLPENLPDYMSLVKIIKAWPQLSDELKKAIVKIIS